MSRKSFWLIFLLCLLILLGVIYIINPAGTHSKDPRARLIGYMPYRIPSGSMAPTLKRGDYILANTFSYHSHAPERGDVIVFNFPARPEMVFVKRVVGIPGDVIEVNNHQVAINGQTQSESYLQTYRRFSAENANYQTEVPEGMLFVLGDNRDRSADSRAQGFVPIKNVIGEVTRIWLSYDDKRVGPLDREEQPEPIQPEPVQLGGAAR